MSDQRSAEEREQFEELYREHFSSVLSYLLSRTDPEMAKEVVADTFLVAWRRLGEVPDGARPWLIGVARNVLSSHRRAALRRDALTDRIGHHHNPDLSNAEDPVLDRRVVLGALERLSVPDREVLRLVAWDGLPYAEAAAVLGCTRAGFAVRLHRARRRFERALEEAEGAEQLEDLAPPPQRGGRPRPQPVDSNEKANEKEEESSRG